MPDDDILTIFLSAASREFHAGDEDRGTFRSYRDCLQRDLSTIRQVHVISQENLHSSAQGDLLETIEEAVTKADITIHLIGKIAGETAKTRPLRKLRERHPNFLDHEPEIKSDFVLEEISYTQWEFYFSVHHQTDRFVYRSKDETPVRPGFAPTEQDLISQEKHLARAKQICNAKYFLDQNDLIRQVFIELLSHDILVLSPRKSTPSALARARKSIVQVMESVRGLVKKPNPVKVPVLADSQVNVFASAISEVAESNEIAPSDLVAIQSEYQDTLIESLEANDFQSHYELALFHFSMGELSKAHMVASQSVAIAEQKVYRVAR